MGLREYEARIISQDLKISQYFEEAIKFLNEPIEISKWIVSEILSFKDYFKIKPEYLASLVRLVKENRISRVTAKDVLKVIYETGKEPEVIIKEKGLEEKSDKGEIENIIKSIIEKNQKEFERLKNGEEKLIGFFVGEVMKATRGRADPKIVNALIRKYAGINKG